MRTAIEKMNQGQLVPHNRPNIIINGQECDPSDPQYEDTFTSVATNDSEIIRQNDKEIETQNV